MLGIDEEIDSLSNFKRNTTQFLQQLKDTGRPVVLTINGEAEFVVKDAYSFRKLIELVDRLEAIDGIRQGIESFERGEGKPVREALDEIRRKHDIPNE